MKPWTDFMDEEICLALISRNPRMRFDETWQEFPDLTSRLKDSAVSRVDRGAITMTRRLDRVYKGNIVLIGDASGSVDAITGEGLSQSFCQALALADALEAGHLESYQTAHRRLAWRPNLTGRLLLQFARYPSLRKRAMRALTMDADLFSRLIASYLGESSAFHSVTTSARLGWQLLAA
jgi:flavin-dependent dehydrogenase